MSEPRVEQLAEGVTLYLGDCREILPTLGRFDAVVTDPPYDVFTHAGALTKSERHKEFGVTFGALEELDFVSHCLDRCDGWLVFFCGLEMLGKYQAQDPSKYVRGGVWDRICNAPQISGDRPAQGAEGIAIFHGVRKNMKWNGGGKAAIYRHLVERGNKEHPTQKPISLITQIIELFSFENDDVFDPFMGSGTTGVAAVKLGRKFTGIEIDDRYFDIACRRISEALKQPDLFIEPPKPAKQEALL